MYLSSSCADWGLESLVTQSWAAPTYLWFPLSKPSGSSCYVSYVIRQGMLHFSAMILRLLSNCLFELLLWISWNGSLFMHILSLKISAGRQQIWCFDWWIRMLSLTRHFDRVNSSVMMSNIKIYSQLRKTNA